MSREIRSVATVRTKQRISRRDQEQDATENEYESPQHRRQYTPRSPRLGDAPIHTVQRLTRFDDDYYARKIVTFRCPCSGCACEILGPPGITWTRPARAPNKSRRAISPRYGGFAGRHIRVRCRERSSKPCDLRRLADANLYSPRWHDGW